MQALEGAYTPKYPKYAGATTAGYRSFGPMCMHSKAWLAARVSLRLARLPRSAQRSRRLPRSAQRSRRLCPTRAVAPVFPEAFVSMRPKLRYPMMVLQKQGTRTIDNCGLCHLLKCLKRSRALIHSIGVLRHHRITSKSSVK